jgi:hypothetical protein
MKYLKSFLNFILMPFYLLIANISDPKYVLTELNKMLWYYYNVDKINTILERNVSNPYLKDGKISKIKSTIIGNKKMKNKYKTVDDYMKMLKKLAFFFNYRNKNYLKNQLELYKNKLAELPEDDEIDIKNHLSDKFKIRVIDII